MTLNKAYKTLIINMMLMMTTIIFFALEISKLNLKWGMMGFVISAIISIFSIIFSIQQIKHSKENNTRSFMGKYRYEIMDWISFFSISMMTIFFIFNFFILPSDVKHSSMMPTLEEGDRILISHFNYKPKIDDIVIVRITKDNYPLVPASMYIHRNSEGEVIGTYHEIFFVKRIYAKAGDHIEFVNFNFAKEYYELQINGIVVIAKSGQPYYVYQNQKVIIESSLDNGILRQGLYLAFGDNANGYMQYPSSYDSRSFGAIYASDLIGKAVFKLWPMGGIS